MKIEIDLPRNLNLNDLLDTKLFKDFKQKEKEVRKIKKLSIVEKIKLYLDK